MKLWIITPTNKGRAMLYIVWKNRNRLGIPIIDEQHRGIVSTINSLYFFMRSGLDQKVLEPTINILKQSTIIHFETEEALISMAGYPGLREHRRLHEKLTKRIDNLSISSFESMDSDTVLKFLRGWWLGHINEEDRKYAPYVLKIEKDRK